MFFILRAQRERFPGLWTGSRNWTMKWVQLNDTLFFSFMTYVWRSRAMFKLERHDAFRSSWWPVLKPCRPASQRLIISNEKASESIVLLIRSQMLKCSVQFDMTHEGLAAVRDEKTELFGNRFSDDSKSNASGTTLPTSSSEGSMAT